MAETGSIAKMADRLSAEIFNVFNWERTGPLNANWPCDNPQHDGKTHPSDVVFYYDSPYKDTRTYIACDLKSYGRSSISKAAIHKAAKSLAKALSCAENSAEWQEQYVHENVTADICALLFVYNHDGEYDSDFQDYLHSLTHEELNVPKGARLFILGPRDIYWLHNVTADIIYARGTKTLPEQQYCQYHYPNLVRHKKLQPTKARAATLEMLTGPWIILEYNPPTTTTTFPKGYVIYYRRRGEKTDEFLYLIDYLLHYQFFDDNPFIRIKLLDAHHNAPALFSKAIDEYVDEHEGGEDLKTQLKAIDFAIMQNVHKNFSEQQIGMEDA